MDTTKKPYCTWEVGGEEYKLKLTAANIEDLEKKYKTNLVNLMVSDSMPALSTMLDVTHAAMGKYHHKIKRRDVTEIFDEYIDGGGSQAEFYASVYMQIFTASGFFSAKTATEFGERAEEMTERM